MRSTAERIFDYLPRLDGDAGLEEMVQELYAPDATFADPIQKAAGHDAILEMYRDMQRIFPQIDASLLRRISDDRREVVEWEMTFKPKYWPTTIPLQGTTWLELDENGRITNHQDYWDLWEFLRGTMPLQELVAERIPEPLKALLSRKRKKHHTED